MSENSYSGSKVPNQKLTKSQKISKFGSVEKWAKDTIRTILDSQFVNASHNKYDTNYKKQVNYDLVAGIFDKKDLEYVDKPYGGQYNFPATLTHYDLISPKINVLAGEEEKRPFNFRVVSTNPDSVSELHNIKKELIVQKYMNELLAALEPKGVSDEQGPQEVPEDIEKYMSYTYKDLAEISGQKALEYLFKKLKLKSRFSTGWRDLLISGEEVYKVGILSGEPHVREVNNLYFDFDRSPNLRYIEDAAWARETRYLSAPDIYDEFYEDLSDDQVQKIEDLKSGDTISLTNSSINIPIEYKGQNQEEGDLDASDIHLTVEHVEWRSLRKIGILKFFNEERELDEMLVGEDYKISSDEDVDWFWVNEVWEGTRIAKEIYVRVRPLPNQRKSLSNPSACKLSYVGIAYNNRNSKAYSLVEVMKPHQYLYNIIMYRLELEMARAKGKKALIDIAQIPRSWGFDIEKWLYYFDSIGIAFVNSFEEGEDKFAGQRPSFNQFGDIDLSLGRIIDQYVMILDKIESMLDGVSGVSPQREGAVHQSETVGGVERAITQSSHITEPLFAVHHEAKTNVMQALLDTAKVAWADGKKLSYIGDDMSRAFFSINGDDFSTTEEDVFVSDTTKDAKNIEMLKSLAQPAMQNGTPLSAIADMLMKDSIADIKKSLKEIEDTQAEREQASQEAELNSIQSQHERDMEFKIMQEEGEEIRNIRDNETKLQIALLGNGEEGIEIEDTTIENRKVELQEKKIEGDLELKRKQLTETAKKNAEDLKLKREELSIKRTQANKKAITSKS
jgi:hypothetical protein